MSNLPGDDFDFRKWLASRLNPFESLHPDSELYVPLNQGTPHDPIDLIFQDILLSSEDSLNFISGFSGSGKSTELQRLKSLLVANGFFAVIADADEYFLPSEPVAIDVLLMKLAGAYSDQIQRLEGIDATYQSWWNRLYHWLKTTEVNLEGIDLKGKGGAEVLGVGKLEAEAGLKLVLKENASFVAQLTKVLAARPGALRQQVHDFFADATQHVRKKYSAALSPVFILDSFEKLSDRLSSEGRVAESIITVLSNHLADLAIPGHHVVLTMPPWVKLLPKSPQKVRLIYGVKLWENNDKRSDHNPGINEMRAIVEKRFTSPGLDRFFGPANNKGHRVLVDHLIRASGGHLRDLIVLLRETLLRTKELPTTKAMVSSAMANHRDSFLPLSSAHASSLSDIGRLRQCALPDTKHDTIYMIAGLLNAHFAFLLRNSAEWCDIHPLLRDVVDSITAKARLLPVSATLQVQE